jgi:hypothetical protein
MLSECDLYLPRLKSILALYRSLEYRVLKTHLRETTTHGSTTVNEQPGLSVPKAAAIAF